VHGSVHRESNLIPTVRYTWNISNSTTRADGSRSG